MRELIERLEQIVEGDDRGVAKKLAKEFSSDINPKDAPSIVKIWRKTFRPDDHRSSDIFSKAVRKAKIYTKEGTPFFGEIIHAMWMFLTNLQGGAQ